MRFKEKSVIITGGARGIGRSIALAFSREGANILISDIALENKVVNEIKSMNSEACAIKVDITKSDQVGYMTETALNKFGKIDILVNNAAVNYASLLWELEETKYDALFDVNVKGVFLCCKAVVPHMIKNRDGKIVNIASWVGKRAVPNFTAYSATKFAVIGLTQGLALEVAGYNINVNAVCPGNVMTGLWDPLIPVLAKGMNISEDMVFDKFIKNTPLKRPQTPDDIANAVLFLCSKEATEITGESLCVTGGAEYA